MSRLPPRRQILGLLAWLALCFGAAAIGGFASASAGDFYQALSRPTWAPDDAGSFELAVDAFAAINKAKADGQVSAGRVVEQLTLVANAKTLERVAAVLPCALDAARCLEHSVEAAELEDGVFEVRGAVFAEKVEKG